MASKGSATRACLRPSFAKDGHGLYVNVVCEKISGQLYPDKMTKKSPGKCILVSGQWYTPSEVECLCGKRSMGKQLADYDLSCSDCPIVDASLSDSNIPSCNVKLSSDNNSACSSQVVPGQTETGSVHLLPPCNTGSNTAPPLLVDTALSFFKAFRLKGDIDSLRMAVTERFSSKEVENAKASLWDHCKLDLEAKGFVFHVRRDSDRRSQLAAKLLLFPALCLPLLLLLLPLPQLFRVVMAVIMAPLRCCSFNYRGWNSGKLTLTNSLDLCFIQEHWLFYDHLSDVSEISPDFISVGVSGMNSDLLSRGRPYGGCSILYRKSLSSCISPLYSCSDHFCGVRLSDSSGLSYILVCVYMPTYYDSDSCCSYLNILGEFEGFIASHACDVNIIVGDFNVDFDRGGPLLKLLDDFMLEFDLSACDLNFCPSVGYTYESDDSVSRFWIDHILCSQHMSSCITDIKTVQSAFFKLLSLAILTVSCNYYTACSY